MQDMICIAYHISHIMTCFASWCKCTSNMMQNMSWYARCDMQCICVLRKERWWTRHQLGKPSMPLEIWDDFGWNRYKDHRERMHGLQMARQVWHKAAINCAMLLSMQQETMLQHPNIKTKHMAVIYRRCFTKEEHWAMAKSQHNRFKQAWRKCKKSIRLDMA